MVRSYRIQDRGVCDEYIDKLKGPTYKLYEYPKKLATLAISLLKYPWCTPIKCDGIQILTSQLPHSRHNKPTRAQQQKRSLMKSADNLLRNTDNLPYEAARALLTTNTGVFNIP